ncbi:MAG TPA: hypothetical protein PKA00_05540 [Saprospiraceae bacterium]|nr:hypothetical protein [Saprospiraceae bacterium]HMQ82344.1 hypothetical protein [Saprospiraceae bacterium]
MNLQLALSQRIHKEEAQAIAAYIGKDPARFAQLIDLVLGKDEAPAKYGSWIIAHVMEKHPHLIHPHLEAILAYMDSSDTTETILRGIVKALAEAGDLPEELQGGILQHCFDLLLDPKTPVAIQVHAMQTIFNISKPEPDLLRELCEVLQEGMRYGSGAYQARAKRILKEIGKLHPDL